MAAGSTPVIVNSSSFANIGAGNYLFTLVVESTYGSGPAQDPGLGLYLSCSDVTAQLKYSISSSFGLFTDLTGHTAISRSTFVLIGSLKPTANANFQLKEIDAWGMGTSVGVSTTGTMNLIQVGSVTNI
jgi:hypothetical protein